jgi:hypothetical protein
MRITRFLVLILSAVVLFACKKTIDWREARVGSYTMTQFYEVPIKNFTTGQVFSYQLVQDTLLTNHNVQLTKSDYSDKFVVKMDGAFLMDVDKDGYCSKQGAGMYFVKDTLHITLDNLVDSVKWGRHHLVGFKN